MQKLKGILAFTAIFTIVMTLVNFYVNGVNAPLWAGPAGYGAIGLVCALAVAFLLSRMGSIAAGALALAVLWIGAVAFKLLVIGGSVPLFDVLTGMAVLVVAGAMSGFGYKLASR